MYHQPVFNLDQNHRIAHTNMVVSYDTYPQTNPSIPIYPPVKLKKLAFYDVLAELIKPSTLIPTNNHQRVQEKAFAFTLTPEQATKLAMNRDIRNPNKIEHVIQVQLRFCPLDTTTEQEDCFPPNVIVKVNNKPCQLPVRTFFLMIFLEKLKFNRFLESNSHKQTKCRGETSSETCKYHDKCQTFAHSRELCASELDHRLQ